MKIFALTEMFHHVSKEFIYFYLNFQKPFSFFPVSTWKQNMETEYNKTNAIAPFLLPLALLIQQEQQRGKKKLQQES